MRTVLAPGLLAAIVLVAPAIAQTPAGGRPAPPAPTIKVGQPAPDFTLNYLAAAAGDERPQQKTVTLSTFRGRQPVVLAFFPAAFSPG